LPALDLVVLPDSFVSRSHQWPGLLKAFGCQQGFQLLSLRLIQAAICSAAAIGRQCLSHKDHYLAARRLTLSRARERVFLPPVPAASFFLIFLPRSVRFVAFC
jgi:hypothetical protein